MINYKQGNIFTTTANVLGHGVNCMGAYGAGMAKQVSTHFPLAKQQYFTKLDFDDWDLGQVQLVDCDRIIIANMATQFYPGPHAELQAIEKCLRNVLDFCKKMNYTLALPQIGCGIGGLSWASVEGIIKSVAEEYPEVELEIWSL